LENGHKIGRHFWGNSYVAFCHPNYASSHAGRPV
jgi:hypothetical protein